MEHINPTSSITKQHRLDERPVAPGGKAGEDLEKMADLQALRKACNDFESILVYTLLKTMRESLPKPEGAGVNRKIYTSIGDLEVARSIAHGRGIGLGDLLFEQLRQKGR